MPRLHNDGREVVVKLLYWGAPGAGTTTNLRWLVANAPEPERGRLIELTTESEQGQAFEFLPLASMPLGPWQLRWHLYTVPGAVADAAVRTQLRSDADGVVFVADARGAPLAPTLQAFAQCLAETRGLPVVVQYNGTDPPDAAAVTELRGAFEGAAAGRTLGHQVANALAGDGVPETLQRCMEATLLAAGPPEGWR